MLGGGPHASRVSWLVLTIATMLARIAPSSSGQALTTADHFRLGFGCPLISHVLGLIGAVSGFQELEAEEFVMLGSWGRIGEIL